MTTEQREVLDLVKKTKQLYNPDATEDIKVFGGDTTNILNLNNVKYQWAHNIFDAIYANNWLPHKVSMGDDKQMIKKLTDKELKAFKTILSFLVFLDSIQTNNLPNIAEYITAPDIVYVLARQTYDEAIHSKSYGWIFSSIFSKKEAEEIVYEFRNNPLLGERNKFIADEYQMFKDAPTDEKFIRVAVANYLLEGLYFYNGFHFFHNLASRGLMTGSQTQIKYIQRDEIQHCNIFKNIILEIQRENTELFEKSKEMIYDMFRKAVEQEIKFSQSIIGMSCQSIEDYTHYRANEILKDIKMDAIFPKKKNPYKHLAKIGGVEDETSNRDNNFEKTSIAYKNPAVLSGWDKL